MLQTILSGNPPYPPSCPLSIIKTKKFQASTSRDERGEKDEKSIIFPCYKRSGEPRAYSTNIQVSRCHTLLLTLVEPPFPKTIITRTPRLYHGNSVIPRSREGRGSRCIRLMASRERWRPPWEEGFVGLRTELEDLFIYLLNWAKSKNLHLGKKFVIFAWPALLLPLQTLTHHRPNSKSTQTLNVQKTISFNFSFSSIWLVRKLRKMRGKKNIPSHCKMLLVVLLVGAADGEERWWEPQRRENNS